MSEEDICPEHQRKLEIICISDRSRICSNCALFGAHKGHDIRMETEVVSEITLRTELLMQIYQLVQETSENRIDQNQVQLMANDFQAKSSEMKRSLKDKFTELKMILKIQEQIAETILKKNLSYIEGEISKLRRVPQRLFEDADEWSIAAKQKLDKFEENMDKPNFINYDMLETKDAGAGPDIVNFGETLITELEEHKDISASRVKSQINQLGLTFNNQVVG